MVHDIENTTGILLPLSYAYATHLRIGLWRIFRDMKEDKSSSSTCENLFSLSKKTKFDHKKLEEDKKMDFGNRIKMGGKEKSQSRGEMNSSSRQERKLSRPRISPFLLILIIAFVLLSLSVNFSEGCGPGRGSGRRRAPRKLTPLVYKQHVPNIPENVLSASGHTEGKITKNSPKFKDLVPNYNTDISFRDDEGTGADRLMTQRCKEKLNTLAISVMNQWPGVRLRVIEGWDEENLHAAQSLHYEGRAVDITTSDKDRSKYGMLARLAVEAGFDWVYYESRAHIHCSVKSDSSQAGRSGGCFSANSTVMTRDRGVQPLSNIHVGDELQSVDPSSGEAVFSPVLLFLDRNVTETREFLHVVTNRTRLTITPSHLLFSIRNLDPNAIGLNITSSDDELLSQALITFARSVQVGDWLLTYKEGGSLVLDKVLKVEYSMETGVIAPLTISGTIVVDGVLSSCYALIESQRLAHSAFLPIRLMYNMSNTLLSLWHRFSLLATLFKTSNDTDKGASSSQADLIRILSQGGPMTRNILQSNHQQEGIYWYASFLYSLTRRILPTNLLYDDFNL